MTWIVAVGLGTSVLLGVGFLALRWAVSRATRRARREGVVGELARGPTMPMMDPEAFRSARKSS